MIVKRLFNLDENSSNPNCPTCGKELSAFSLPHVDENKIILNIIREQLNEYDIIYLCTKCLDLNNNDIENQII